MWSYCLHSSDCSFNPLQVFYKRYYFYLFYAFQHVFQSLIGILQTCCRIWYCTHSYPGFNPLQVFYKLTSSKATQALFSCFNPLQVFYKQLTLREYEFSIAGFNPLQVFYKRALATTSSMQLSSFNPLQVFYKLKGGEFHTDYIFEFQSLIGILQTFLVVFQLRPIQVVSIPYRYSTNN